jgi:hypothetical protein
MIHRAKDGSRDPFPLELKELTELDWGGGCAERRVTMVVEPCGLEPTVTTTPRVELGFEGFGRGFIADGLEEVRGSTSAVEGGWAAGGGGGAKDGKDRDAAEDGDRRRRSQGHSQRLKTTVT